MEIDLKLIRREFKNPMQIGTSLVSNKEFLEGTIDNFDFELSVLTGLHQESFEQAKSQLTNYLDGSIQKSKLYPSVLFAIEAWENLKTKDLVVPNEVQQNALLLKPDLNELTKLRSLGFKSFKLKIARSESANDISTFLKNLKNDEKIRLDGNQKMTPDQLVELLEKLKNYWSLIDYIEEPFKDHLQTANWSHTVPLALDESLSYFLSTSLPSHIKNVVLKPSLYGFKKSLEIIASLNSRNIVVTLSSSFEGPIGLSAIFALAHFQNTHHPNPAGLDTLKYFKTI